MVFPWPYQRLHYDGIDNPIYDQDIQVAMEAVLQAAMMLTGMEATDFAIIWGMDYDGAANYTAGLFILNGVIYWMPNGFQSGQALGPNVTVLLAENFDDGQGRTIYNQNSAIVAAYNAGTTTPVFGGNMNAYRVGGKALLTQVNFLLTVAAALGSAAYLNIGSTAGTVMAGNDPRAPYTAGQLAALFAPYNGVIIKNAGTPYTPVAPTDPANKGYIDGIAVIILAKGRTTLGDIPAGGISLAISFGVTLPNINYQLVFTLVSLGTPANDATAHTPTVIDSSKSTSSLLLRFQEGVGTIQDIAIDWTLIPH